MSEPRTFSVCQGCGSWRETGTDLTSFFADYDTGFFVEQHGACCPVTGKPEVLLSISEADPNYEALLPEKRWLPETCPDYKPPQEPKFIPYIDDAPKKIIGVWCRDDSVGGAYDETMVLRPDGEGILDFWNMGAYCGRDIFKWRIDGVGHIAFEGTQNYFQTERPRFEVGRYSNLRGEERDMLRIFDHNDDNPTQFLRSMKSLDDYRVEEW